MSFNLATMLVESRNARPQAPLLHYGDTTLTNEEVDRASARIAGWLAAQGLQRGSRIAVQLPNGPEFVYCYQGALRAGLVTVPLNPLLRPGEVAHQLADSGASLLITGGDRLDDAAAARTEAGLPRLPIVSVGAPASAGTSHVHHLVDFGELLASQPLERPEPTDPQDTAVIIYTSGTTGRPKGAELTHFQLYMNCTIAGERVGISPDDVILGALPFFHVFGLSSVLNTALRFGSPVVLVPRFEPSAVLAEAARRAVSVFIGVPTMFIAVRQAAAAAGIDLPTLRCGISGGAPMPGRSLQDFEAQFPAAVLLEGYGSTESASVVTASRSAQDRRAGSIGKPIWGVEVRIVDESGTELPAGAANVGELHFRGHNVMKGYFRQPEKTAESLRDGWFHTGDLGYRDEDGYLYIVDRKKDLVIRGGYNIYPREVEEVLYTHPAVLEAAVYGEPDERLGEEVVAAVALRPGAQATPDEIREFVKDSVAAYKYPRRVHIVDDLPKSANGKILKRVLRRSAADGAAAQAVRTAAGA
ncbi:long-chain-fatty-acid--CoA ligase [Tomitella fengzijianii]|uniref:long-chain-fatty-acid--CoA ligase n=1 Tax=Tomitella fengzijianii TaxID=2597660 RepID=UPI00131B11A7|nr:long-chain fatty acid--CoA ligase [Tomitella fengzijianii]